MAMISTLKQSQQEIKSAEAKSLLLKLIQPSQYVGDVYSVGYEFANVQVHDFYRKQVGGVPSLCFLIATRIKTDAQVIEYQREDSSVILLRVMDATPLPNEKEAERVRVETAQRVSGEQNVHWDESENMDATTAHLLSFAGVRCRVIGTFFVDISERLDKLVLKFGSDLSNYYPNQDLKVYKPNQEALAAIANYIDPDRIDPNLSQARVQIGEVRYASTNRSFQGVSNVQVDISPVDLLGQKTALFGMTRTGKSNTTKIILQSVFGLRFTEDRPLKIGQVVFDPNGEYANENTQDANNQKNPSAIKNVWQSFKNGQKSDVVTYGILKHKYDPDRKLMLLNFYEEENLQIGKEIIDEVLELDGSKFIQNFRQVVFAKPDEQDKAMMVRYKRRVLAYRALLAKADFPVPGNIRSLTKGLFNKNLLAAMESSKEPSHNSAASIFRNSTSTWKQVALAFEGLADFMTTDMYKQFEQEYVKGKNSRGVQQVQASLLSDTEADEAPSSGETWADEDLKKILEMFRYPNGSRQIGKAREQHTDQTTSDYAEDIYKELVAGRLVIVDQSSGDPDVNRSAAERIMWQIFQKQQERFRGADPAIPEILVYVEEAHNLLPYGTDTDLQDIWVRTAKEGAKYHIGLVYATQEVSSIQKNILKNTANWFIGHLNNTDETKELCKYYDFEDFESSIRRAQDRGFLRMKTLSNLFVVPIQVRKFEVSNASL